MNSQTKFAGVISALPTPFLNKKIDFESLTKLLEYQLLSGIQGFVVNGTTAESPALSWPEVEALYLHTRKVAGFRVPIILGTGSNSTEHTIEITKKAQGLGADAALVVVPYYNKPPQRGLEAHFCAVAENTEIPILLYNVPGRSLVSLEAETVFSLADQKNIIGIKEASGDIVFAEKLKAKLPPGFVLLSGDDGTYLDFIKVGGSGIISVMSNVITAACVEWTKLAEQKKWNEAYSDFEKYKELIALMYAEANPIPVKWMLQKMGLFASAEMRLPLVSLHEKQHEKTFVQLKKLGLINDKN